MKQNEQDASESAGYDIIISCNVPTATMFIDGSSNGFASGSRFLKTGSHSIRLTADGYKPLSQTIYVNSNSRSFSFTMKKKTLQEPSATMGDVKIAVLPEGEIICKKEKLTIEGAKGKDVNVWVVFENKETDEADVIKIKEKLTPPYDISNYKTFRIFGHVSNFKTLRDNRGSFEVYAWILIDNDSRGIGESETRNMTIYRQGNWKSRGGGMVED